MYFYRFTFLIETQMHLHKRRILAISQDDEWKEKEIESEKGGAASQ